MTTRIIPLTLSEFNAIPATPTYKLTVKYYGQRDNLVLRSDSLIALSDEAANHMTDRRVKSAKLRKTNG